MPRIREDLHTAVCAREECGKEFFQRTVNQRYCSQACSNKEFPGTGGRNPAVGLSPRQCENPACDNVFQPYRDSQRTCSRVCYTKLADVKEKISTHHKQPHIKERKNKVRRVDTAPDPAARRTKNQQQNLRRYGTTPEEYAAKLEAQSGVCAICGKPPTPGGTKAASCLHQDHDHVTNQNRDLLCCTCNPGIGYFQDDPDLLRAAADYIERHRAGVLV